MEISLTGAGKCALFDGIAPQEVGALLVQLHATTREHDKGEILVMAGYENRAIGIVLSGAIAATKMAADGTQVTIAQMGAGGIFGDVLSGSHTKSPVTVTAVRATTVLWLPVARILQGGCCQCAVHARLMQNLVGLISDKYFQLSRRVDVLLVKSVRGKILHYLRHEAQVQADGSLLVPLTRAAWAEHLGCERTALCRELGRMRDDGVLQVSRQHITLL